MTASPLAVGEPSLKICDVQTLLIKAGFFYGHKKSAFRQKALRKKIEQEN